MTATEFLSIDYETRSTVNLRQTGVYVYAEHPTTDLWCCAYAFGEEEEVNLWTPPNPVPNRVADHILGGGKITCWNAAFERIITKKITAPRYGWPEPKLSQYYDTAAQAAAASLPRALDNAAAALGMNVRKDKEGYNLMMRMCKPRRVEDNGTIVWWDEPDRIQRLGEYCKQDVVVERGIGKRLRPLSDSERLIYLLDQHINDKGILLDRALVQKALKIVHAANKDLDQRLRNVTCGAVPRASLVAKLKTWLASLGVKAELMDEAADEEDELESLDKQAIKALLATDLPADARTAIEIRSEAAKSSTKKLISMQRACCDDGRMRGLLLYHGAGTGRWAGKLVQPQNFPKGTIKNTDAAIKELMHGDAERVDLIWGSPLDVVASCLRGFMVAKPGHRFIVCDFAAIEARVNAWLAGETALVELFATGGDPYCYMAERVFGREVTKANFVERFIGKQLVLGCFGADTLVMTDSGWKRIKNVRISDRVWDGVDFVEHDGLVPRGPKEVIDFFGVLVTPDHEILTGEGWKWASQVLQESTRFLASARELARLPSLATSWVHGLASSLSVSSAIVALLRMTLTRLVSSMVGRHGVTSAQRRKQARHRNTRAVLSMQWLTTLCVRSGRLVMQPFFLAAQILTARHFTIMAGEGSPYQNDGSVVASSCLISKHSSAGIIQSLNWIGSETTDPTRCPTSKCQHAPNRLETHVATFLSRIKASAGARKIFKICSRLSSATPRYTAGYWHANRHAKSLPTSVSREVNTYDIANAGPRNRFVILTAEGPMIAHNCGYQMGAPKFIATCNKLSAELKIDVTVDMELAEPAIRTYRETNTQIVNLWRELEDAAFEAVRRPGITTSAARGRIRFRKPGDFLYMALPSGRVLSYARAFIGPRMMPWGDVKEGVRFFSVPSQTVGGKKKKLSDEDRALPGTMPGRWEITDIYGGKYAENAVQAISRDLLAQAMLRLEKRQYNVILHAHDETVSEVPIGFGSVHEVSEIMCERPVWAQDCPIAAEGFECFRYRKG